MSETEFLVTSLVAEVAFIPASMVESTVRSSPNARMAMPMATIVSPVLTLRLKAFFMIILRRIMN